MLKRRYKLLTNFIRAVASLLMGSGHVPPSRVFFLLNSVHSAAAASLPVKISKIS